VKQYGKVWLAAGLYWLVASALSCWLYPVTIADTCARYAPMADAFARGDFYYAFHPRFGLVFETLSGVVTFVTGLPGIYSVQVAAFLLLALSGVVMFAFVKCLGASDRVAWWTLALTLLAPDYFCFALDGLRESGKCLVFALVGYGVVAKRSWAFATALFLYIALFTYGFATASAMAFVWCVWFAWRREWKMIPLPVFGWMAGTGAVTILTHAYTGHWLPVPQLIEKLGRWL